jgi:hypothetical protein
MILTEIASAKVMGGLLTVITNAEVKAITYPTRQPILLLEQLTLTLAFLTTNELQHIWQIRLDSTLNVMDVFIM